MSFKMTPGKFEFTDGVGGDTVFSTDIALHHITDRVAGVVAMPEVVFGGGGNGGSQTTVIASGLTTQANFIQGSVTADSYGSFSSPFYFDASGTSIIAAWYVAGGGNFVDIFRTISFELDGLGNLLASDEWNSVSLPSSGFTNTAYELIFDIEVGAFT